MKKAAKTKVKPVESSDPSASHHDDAHGFEIYRDKTLPYVKVPCGHRGCVQVTEIICANKKPRWLLLQHQREMHAGDGTAWLRQMQINPQPHPLLLRGAWPCPQCDDVWSTKGTCSSCREKEKPDTFTLPCWKGREGNLWLTEAHAAGQRVELPGHQVDDNDILEVAAQGDCGLLAVLTEYYQLSSDPTPERLLELRGDCGDAIAMQIAQMSLHQMRNCAQDAIPTEMRARALYFDLDLNAAHDKIEHIIKLIELQILRACSYLGITQLGALANSLDLNLVVYVADKSDPSRRVVLNMSAVLGHNEAVFWVGDEKTTVSILYHPAGRTTDGNWEIWGATAAAHFAILQPWPHGHALRNKRSQQANTHNNDKHISNRSITGDKLPAIVNKSDVGQEGTDTSDTNKDVNSSIIKGIGDKTDDNTNDLEDDDVNNNDDGSGSPVGAALNNDSDNETGDLETHSKGDFAMTVKHCLLDTTHELRTLHYHQKAISTLTFDTVKVMSSHLAAQFAEIYVAVLGVFLKVARRPQSIERDQDLEVISLFRYILPGLLLSPDNSVSRAERFQRIHDMKIGKLVNCLLKFAANKPVHTRQASSDDSLRKRAVALCKTPGGVTKATRELSSTERPATPSSAVLAHLKAKHPWEDGELIAVTARAALDGATVAVAKGEDMLMVNSKQTREAAVRAVVCKANYHTAPGPNGLRYAHLQQLLTTQYAGKLIELLAEEVDMLLSFECPELTTLYWLLHTNSQLTALGVTKLRPLAIGEIECRLVGATFMTLHKQELATVFEAELQYAIGTPAGCELLAMIAQLHRSAGHWLELGDVANAYNTMSKQKILEGLALLVPALVPYFKRAYADNTPQLLYHLPEGNEVVLSHTGAQQGCPLGGLFFCAGLALVMRDINGYAAAHGALQTVAFADDMVTPVATGQFATDAHYQQFTQKEAALAAAGCTLSRPKTVFVPPPGHKVTDAERYFIENTIGAKLAPRGAVIAGVAVGEPGFVREQLHAIVDPDVDSKQYLQLAKHIALLPDKQTSLLLLSKCLAPRLVHTARTTAPQQFNAEVGTATDRINVWAMERIMCLPQTAQVSIEQLLDTSSNTETTALQHHQQQQLKLPVSRGGFGITSLSHISHAAHTAATTENLPKALSIIAKCSNDETTADPLTTHLNDAAVVWDLLNSIKALLTRGVDAASLAVILPADWVSAAVEGDAVAGYKLLSDALAAGAATSIDRKNQAKLAELLHNKLAAEYQLALHELPVSAAARATGCESRDEAKARHLSLVGAGAQSWLTCRITEQCALQNPEVTMACRRSAGIRTSFGDSHCPFHGDKQTTTEAQPSTLQLNNHHAVTCSQTGLQNTLHKDMVYAMVDVMKECNIGGPINLEDTRCFNGPKAYAAENRTKHSMDLTAPIGAARAATDPKIRDKVLMIDISVRNPCGDTAISRYHSNTVAGAAAAKAETDKAKKYTGTFSPVTSTLITAAFETFGRIGTSLKFLLTQFVVHWAAALVGDQRAAQMGRKMKRLREILSVALQKALYRRELRYVQALRVKCVSDVPMFEALWDMSEADMSDVYGTYTVSDLQQAAVVLGGGVRAVVSSAAAVVGG
jgi:hypothetical protein